MDDLMTTIQGILSSPEGQEQLKQIQSMLGLSAGESSAAGAPSSPAELPANPVPAPAGNASGGFDLSALSGLLGNLSGKSENPPAGEPALPALAEMLSGQNTPAPAGIDLNMVLKLQKVFQAMNSVNDKDTQLLLALKPHFSPRRQAKVDQAMSMMRLFSMMPMLKEIFPF